MKMMIDIHIHIPVVLLLVTVLLSQWPWSSSSMPLAMAFSMPPRSRQLQSAGTSACWQYQQQPHRKCQPKRWPGTKPNRSSILVRHLYREDGNNGNAHDNNDNNNGAGVDNTFNINIGVPQQKESTPRSSSRSNTNNKVAQGINTAPSSASASTQSSFPLSVLPNYNDKYLRTVMSTNSVTLLKERVELQTRVQRFEKRVTVSVGGDLPGNTDSNGDADSDVVITIAVDVHAQVHFADAAYFHYYNNNDNDNANTNVSQFDDMMYNYDKILYELIVSENLICEHPSRSEERRLTLEGQTVLGSSLEAQQTAKAYNLTCQVDEMNYYSSSTDSSSSSSSSPSDNNPWICSDYTRQELDAFQNSQSSNKMTFSSSSSSSPAVSSASEVLQAFLQPTTTAGNVGNIGGFGDNHNNAAVQAKTKLFTNSKSLLRLSLWFLIPVPELSILILDWASLNRSSNSSNNKPNPSSSSTSGALVSPLAIQTLKALLLHGNLLVARKLVFAQMLVSSAGQRSVAGGSSTSTTSNISANPEQRNDVNMVLQRNARAVEVLQQCIQRDMADIATATENSDDQPEQRQRPYKNKYTYALLYGALHCADLQDRLQQQGFQPIEQQRQEAQWRTAWSIDLPQSQAQAQTQTSDVAANSTTTTITANATNQNNNANAIQNIDLASNIQVILWLSLYLGISGVDWLEVLKEVGTCLLPEHSNYLEAVGVGGLYILRHAAMYFGLSKFLIEWDGTSTSGNIGQEESSSSSYNKYK
jgi:hypothetical protein